MENSFLQRLAESGDLKIVDEEKDIIEDNVDDLPTAEDLLAETPQAEVENTTPANEEVKTEVTADVNITEYETKIQELESQLSSLTEKASRQTIEDLYDEESVSLLKKVMETGFDMNKLKSIVEVQTLDVDNLDTFDAISSYLSKKDGLSKEEIKLELKEYRKLKSEDVELMDEDERDNYDAKMAKLNRLEREAKGYLKSLKDSDEYKLPVPKSVDPQAVKAAQEAESKKIEELKKLYSAEVDKHITPIEELNIPINDKESFKFKLSAEQKAKVKEAMLGINDYYTNFVDDKGIKFNEMANAVAASLLLPDMIKSAMNSVVNKGEEKAIKEINNVDLSKDSKASSSSSGISNVLSQFRSLQGY